LLSLVLAAGITTGATGDDKAINDLSKYPEIGEHAQTQQVESFRLNEKIEFSDAAYLNRDNNARYLIVTHDSFYNAIKPLAHWKHKKGMITKVVKLSEIGSTSAQIRTYIVNAYNTWQIKPEFLLLVGAPNYVPWSQTGTYSDNDYTNMDTDIYNEILSGRLTVHSDTEAQTVVNKILLYERTPDLEDSLWPINACLIVREDYSTYPPAPGTDDSIYWSDIHHAKNLMLNAGYNTIDTLSKLLGNNSSDIIQSVDSGRAFVLYRGSGVSNWWTPFDVSPDATNNGAKLPIVLSITCCTIGTSSTPAAAERWLLTGTPTEPKGGAGYFATTTVLTGGAYLRSAVCKGFFNGLFEQRKKTFGEACEEGRKKVYTMYSSVSEYKGFTTLGDPEMNIWTGKPMRLEVTHDSMLYVGDDSLYVQVNTNAVPLESALVCIMLDTILYEYGYTSSTGGIGFYLDTLIPGIMDLTVTGRNVVPHETTLVVANNPGINEYNKEFLRTQFSVSPTITKNHVSVFGIEGKIDVYDVTGRIVGNYDIKREGDLDFSGLSPGVYFIKPKETKPVKIVRIR
jgi:hypothetical protein